MESLRGQQTLMRIYISENDKYNHKPLYQVLLDLFQKEKVAGCTVLKGIAGFGAKSHLHSTQLLRLSQNLPLVVEVVDTRDKIKLLILKVDEMVTEGLVTIENVEVIRYAPKNDQKEAQ